MSPSVALINHSCDPNAVVVFPRSNGETRKEAEPLMQVIALKYISPDEEVRCVRLGICDESKIRADPHVVYRHYSPVRQETNDIARDISFHL